LSGLLLDTHALLWWLEDPSRLSKTTAEQIRDPDTQVFVSAASVWEISIKASIGRLRTPANLTQTLESDHLQTLDITVPHALAVADLPRHHNDPFDRMLIAQARLEGLVLVTNDQRIAQYDVRVMMA
jgi:PIN domain nuclease of toxin-antitoxin system